MTASDDRALEIKVGVGLLLTLIIVVFLAGYWASEPGRQEAAAAKFKHEAMERGAEYYVEICAQCHGDAGQGLVGPALKGSALDARPLERIIARGKPGTAMPAWGDEDGGPLKPNQVRDLVIFIQNWDTSLLVKSTKGPH